MIALLAGERQPGETLRAVQACNDYLRMGPGRSLRSLIEEYARDGQTRPPTRNRSTLTNWSARYHWQDRAAVYDARLEVEKNRRADEVMQSGLALAHERVTKLKDLAGKLEGYLQDENNVWLPDVKQIGGGKFAERVDIVRFNAALIEQYRNTLDDLAKETGGRRQSVDLTTGGQPIKGYVTISPDDWDDDDDDAGDGQEAD